MGDQTVMPAQSRGAPASSGRVAGILSAKASSTTSAVEYPPWVADPSTSLLL
jgi:hypothetical protein